MIFRTDTTYLCCSFFGIFRIRSGLILFMMEELLHSIVRISPNVTFGSFTLGILFPFDIKYFISRRHLYPSFFLLGRRACQISVPSLTWSVPGRHYNSRSFRSEQLSAGHKEHSPRYIFFFFQSHPPPL